ncbi:hypothetical protein ACMSI6_10515 [Pseudomonas antarctica]|uniref:Uncharacterized protein n=1 Tax=Pseudomonas antarctica TaxID=219572 RepID=A0ABQ6ZSQ1_9PSED|nr:hypothetical protein [Pseudomonas antarctica]KAF2407437.1 hypothetical protein PSAN_43660 [Pseudomonas antarctica]
MAARTQEILAQSTQSKPVDQVQAGVFNAIYALQIALRLLIVFY